MEVYLALIRGINVGGNSLIKMADLKIALESAGLNNVVSYIQSGNVIFTAKKEIAKNLPSIIESVISKEFQVTTKVAVFTRAEWTAIIDAAPAWWGKDPAWKHNLLILIKPFDMKAAVLAIGQLKPDIEAMLPGAGVLYQSVSFKFFGRTTTGKLAGNPIYKQMTIRNFNTANKLFTIMANY